MRWFPPSRNAEAVGSLRYADLPDWAPVKVPTIFMLTITITRDEIEVYTKLCKQWHTKKLYHTIEYINTQYAQSPTTAQKPLQALITEAELTFTTPFPDLVRV